MTSTSHSHKAVSFCDTCIACFEGRANIRKDWRFDREPKVRVDFVHHRSGRNLMHAVTDGCTLCRSVWDTITYPDPDNPRRQISRPDLLLTDEFELECALLEDENQHGQCFKAVLNSPFHQSVERIHQDRRSISFPVLQLPNQTSGPGVDLGTGSVQSMRMAIKWLADCKQSHSICNQYAQSNWLPTRVLDVSPNLNDDVFQLIDGSALSDSSTYITLSHCWGQADFIKLSSSTENDLRRSCAVELLPQSFRDAISVCRTLKTRYLWIDSICIKQDPDDLSDWLTESVNMDKVYSNALCNISALDAKDANGGMFRPYMQVLDLTNTSAWNLVPVTASHGDHSTLWEDGVVFAPLNNRAWVLQERTLSPRVLHFGRFELFWECSERSASQTHPDEMLNGMKESSLKQVHGPSLMRASRLIPASRTVGCDVARPIHIAWTAFTRCCKPKNLQDNDDALREAENDRAILYEAWDHIVYAYSAANLSIATDRVVALSGVGKRFEQALGDIYVAGMWRSRLDRDLLWAVREHPSLEFPRTPGRNSHHYRAPSFSWLSVEGYVTLQEEYVPKIAPNPFRRTEREVKYLFGIVSLHMEHVNNEPTGPIRSGEIVLKGSLFPIVLSPGNDNDETGSYWNISLRDNSSLGGWGRPDFGREDFPTQSKGDEHFLFLGAKTQYFPPRIICLVLEHSAGTKGTFRRVGLWNLWRDSCMRMINACADRSGLPSLKYDHDDADVKYSYHTIRVV